MPSITARLGATVLRAGRIKQRLFDPDQFVGPKAKRRKAGAQRPPRWLGRGVTASQRDFQGWPVFTLTPRSGGAAGHLLYLHGGAYAAPPTALHWWFLARLAAATDRMVTVPRYPLTPEHTHRDVFATLTALYRDLGPGDRLAVAGDSAGGGMALALAQTLPADVPQPADLVLFSPWLDATLTNPGIAAIDPHDPMLNPAHLRIIGTWYAGADDPAHPAVSPLNGRLDGLGQITVFSGTRDVLHPDVCRLRTLAAERGVVIDVHEYEGMVHDWLLLPMPEARDVLARVADRLGPRTA